MNSQASQSNEMSPSVDADCARRDIASTTWFVLLNALIVVGVAALHPFTQAPDLIAGNGFRAYVGIICLESALLFFPAIVSHCLLIGLGSQISALVARSLALAVSIAYFCDLILYLTIHEHLWSRVTLGLASSLLPSLWWYVSFREAAFLIAAVGGFVLTQWFCWSIAKMLGRSTIAKIELTRREIAVAACCLVALPLLFALPALRDLTGTKEEIRRYADRHPLGSLGWLPANVTPQYVAESDASIRGSSLMLCNVDQIERLKSQYQQMAIVADESPSAENDEVARHPDVLLVISECLRPELIDPKTTPHIFGYAQNGLILENHFSAGNSSNLGFFGLMTGLDSCWFSYAREIPVGMFALLQQSGYEVGFFGRDGFDQFQMETFCGPERFDVTEFVPAEDDIVAVDQEVCRRAQQFLDRQGRYASLESKPRFAFVYMYAPHYSYYSESVDQIHDASDLQRFPSSVRERSESMLIRYLDSAHFVDRTIAPLFRDDRLTFVLGDHGESFGEDGRFMHGTAMSRTQLQVACIGFGPRIPAQRIELLTSHVDVMPTMMDALGIAFESGIRLPGASLLRPISPNEIVSAKSFQSGSIYLRRDQFLGTQPSQPFAYQGFFDLRSRILSPGGYIDTHGISLPTDASANHEWAGADPMLAWLGQQFGEPLSKIPDDPVEPIRQALLSERADVRIEAIRLVTKLGPRAREMLADVEKLLVDHDKSVRTAAFGAIHLLHR